MKGLLLLALLIVSVAGVLAVLWYVAWLGTNGYDERDS